LRTPGSRGWVPRRKLSHATRIFITRGENGLAQYQKGEETLAAALSEERDGIEPYLMQRGLLMRTPRGRVLAEGGWRHIGMKCPGRRGCSSTCWARGKPRIVLQSPVRAIETAAGLGSVAPRGIFPVMRLEALPAPDTHGGASRPAMSPNPTNRTNKSGEAPGSGEANGHLALLGARFFVRPARKKTAAPLDVR
jgi:hypothetical protein